MSETQTQRAIEQKAKLVIKDLGNPKRVEDADGKRRVILGTILGRASGVKATELRGEMFMALTGAFEGIPAEADKPIIRAGICYLPGGFQESVLEALNGGADGTVVDFAMEFAADFAKNPIGYSYAAKPLLNKASNDPLASLKAEVEAMKAIPAPAAKGKAA